MMGTTPILRLAVPLLMIASCGPSVTEATGLQRIEVLPANATITVDNAPAAPVAYTAIGYYLDGHTAELTTADFSLDEAAAELGSMTDADFTASGAVAGTGAVGAALGMVRGQTGVSVVVHRSTIDPSAPADAPGKFPDHPPVGAASPRIAYPLDGAVMPSTVKAPEIQWEGDGGAGDVYRVRMVGGLATSDLYLGYTPRLASLPAAADWRLVVASAGGL